MTRCGSGPSVWAALRASRTRPSCPARPALSSPLQVSSLLATALMYLLLCFDRCTQSQLPSFTLHSSHPPAAVQHMCLSFYIELTSLCGLPQLSPIHCRALMAESSSSFRLLTATALTHLLLYFEFCVNRQLPSFARHGSHHPAAEL